MKADRDESSPYAAMLAAQDVSQRCKVYCFPLEVYFIMCENKIKTCAKLVLLVLVCNFPGLSIEMQLLSFSSES